MSNCVIGIDPGVEGAIVLLSPDGKILKAFNMPILTKEVPKKARKPKKDAPPPKKPKKENPFTIERTCDFEGICQLIKHIKAHVKELYEADDVDVFVESISHLFNLPSVTNFKLGHAMGVTHSALYSLGQDFYLVPTKKWQAVVWRSEDKTDKALATKAKTKNAFEDTFPGYDGINSDGVRDAALIAYCGLRGGA